MNAFLDSLKSDLLDRRIIPLLGLAVVALLGALGYAVLGGGGSGSSTQPLPNGPTIAPSTAGIAVSAVQADAKSSTSETTSGAAEQTGGASRDPFSPTPGAQSSKSASTATEGGSSTSGSSAAATSGSESATSGGSETSGSQSGGSQQQQQQQQPTQKRKQKTYKVSVLFGTAAPGTPALEAGLTSYEELKRQQPLPSAKQPVIVFRGVVVGAKSATFTLVGEAIPHGEAICKPSAAQCQAIDLKVGQTEELEYVPLGGTPVNYELRLVKIEAVNASANGSGKAANVASAARAGMAYGGESQAGKALLRREGLMKLPGLRYSRDGSVLVFVSSEHALAAHAHAAAWGPRPRG